MDTMPAAVSHDFDRLELNEVPQPEARELGTVVVRDGGHI